ncbi:MAG: BatA domain-containing protein [Pirellulaceae bacterium]
MSLLTPLYMLGLAAISLPILFHLIRRTPKGKIAFSSLMFLSATPPRLTRRSRVDQWWLLILRATALALLALAFTRPFWRSAAIAESGDLPERMIVLLVDTSASMRREGLWRQVESAVDEELREVSAKDHVALYSYDHQPTRLLSFDETRSAAASERTRLVRARFAQLRPGWHDSALGDALVRVADELDAVADDVASQPRREIVVISDLQEGSHIESLQAFEWPESVHTRFRQIKPEHTTNATLQLLEAETNSEQTPDLHIRVSSAAASRQQEFQIRWDAVDRVAAAEPVRLVVPPGESRVVRVPAMPAEQPDHPSLLLTGDDHDFDNRHYVVPVEPVGVDVVYVGDDSVDDPEQMLFYLQRGLTSDPRQPVSIRTITAGEVPEALQRQTALVVMTTDVPESSMDAVRQNLERYLEQGGNVLLVLRPAGLTVATLAAITGVDAGPLVEVEPKDYVMLSEVDVQHRLFADFARPPFNDFSQLSFWRYRHWPIPADDRTNVLARFDTGDPALVELPRGRGSLYVLTSGWDPEDSQLARSTKFVPFLSRLAGTWPAAQQGRYVVGQTVSLSPPHLSPPITIRKPDGEEVVIPAGQETFEDTDQPGVYVIRSGAVQRRFVVNLAHAETRTDPLDIAQLEQRGVRVGATTTRAENLAALRQLRDVELEGRQRYWQWLIAATLVVLVIETILPMRIGRRKSHD